MTITPEGCRLCLVKRDGGIVLCRAHCEEPDCPNEHPGDPADKGGICLRCEHVFEAGSTAPCMANPEFGPHEAQDHWLRARVVADGFGPMLVICCLGCDDRYVLPTLGIGVSELSAFERLHQAAVDG